MYFECMYVKSYNKLTIIYNHWIKITFYQNGTFQINCCTLNMIRKIYYIKTLTKLFKIYQ